MSTKPQKDTKALSMDTIRAEIDRVDTALLGLIAERMKLAADVRRAKSGMNVWRPAREQSHVRHIVGLAENTPPLLVSRIWAELTSASLALQGPINLHVALEGDELGKGELVRDRFGAAIPVKTYFTASSALAAASSDPEGVAILPAPGGMHNWWTALADGGAAHGMHILAPLPRIGNWSWPNAVALSRAAIEPAGDDMTLVLVRDENNSPLSAHQNLFAEAGLRATLKSKIEVFHLYSLEGYIAPQSADINQLREGFSDVKVIGILSRPIAPSR